MEKCALFGRFLVLFALFGFAAAGTVQAVSLYKWTDEEGRVHYSQTPPEESTTTNAEQLKLKDSAPYPNQQGQAEEQPATTEQASEVVEQRKKNCEIARLNLEAYKNSDQLKQPDGSVITLSEEMRATKIKETEALVNAYCN